MSPERPFYSWGSGLRRVWLATSPVPLPVPLAGASWLVPGAAGSAAPENSGAGSAEEPGSGTHRPAAVSLCFALSQLPEDEHVLALAAHLSMLAQHGLHLRSVQALSALESTGAGDSVLSELACIQCLIRPQDHLLDLSDELAEHAADLAQALLAFPLTLLAARLGPTSGEGCPS